MSITYQNHFYYKRKKKHHDVFRFNYDATVRFNFRVFAGLSTEASDLYIEYK